MPLYWHYIGQLAML